MVLVAVDLDGVASSLSQPSCYGQHGRWLRRARVGVTRLWRAKVGSGRREGGMKGDGDMVLGLLIGEENGGGLGRMGEAVVSKR